MRGQRWGKDARREPEFVVLRRTARVKEDESGEVSALVSEYRGPEATGAQKKAEGINCAMPERCLSGRKRMGALGNHRRRDICLKISQGPGHPGERGS